jgi:hypothetical protein
LKGKAIRTFVYWKGVYDIDASITLIGDNRKEYASYVNYNRKMYGDDLLFSGDARGSNGSEFYDIKLEEMKARGFKYLVFSFHGFVGRLNEGEVYCGYQNKDNLVTKEWDPKNIELQFRVLGNTRACLAFAIDLTTNEMVVLNQMVEDESQVVHRGTSDAISKYLSTNFLRINMGAIIEARGVKVDTPKEADVVFDDGYIPKTGKDGSSEQKVVHTYDLEKLVSISSGK